MVIGKQIFDIENECYIMGILNVTPDSFSDGGKWNTKDAALTHVEEMISEGAAIIDVGGESTRPGYTRISDVEEIARVTPIIEAIRERFEIPISIDTYKSAVAKTAIEAGADLVNDIWGLKADPKMAEVVAKSGVACCLMHNRENLPYQNFVEDWISDMKDSIKIAKNAGISDDKIILDPGVGFAKSREENLIAIRETGKLLDFGYPVLLGTSRKSVIGLTLDLPKEERVEGTLATTVMGVERGVSFFRVHDIKENYRAMKMAMAIMKGR